MSLTNEALTHEVAALAVELREIKRMLAAKERELRAEDDRSARYKGYLDAIRTHLGMGPTSYSNIIDRLKEKGTSCT